MKTFPVQHGGAIKSVPWDFIAPHEKQADRNHGQTIQRLAERHGCSPCEILAIVEGRRWQRMDDAVARAKLQAAVDAWQADMERAHGVHDSSPSQVNSTEKP